MSDKPARLPKSGRSQLDTGFDRYLARELHGLFDPVLDEAIPDDLLKLAELFESRPEQKAEPDGPSTNDPAPKSRKPDPGRRKA